MATAFKIKQNKQSPQITRMITIKNQPKLIFVKLVKLVDKIFFK